VKALGLLWPRLQHLRELLLCSNVLDAETVQLLQLPEDLPLEVLDVSNCRGLFPHFTPQLAKLTRLEELHAKDCGICADDFAALAPALSSSLTLLHLAYNGGYNAWSPRALYGSLSSLLQLTKLQHLDVQQCVIADSIDSVTYEDGPVCGAVADALTSLTYLAMGASWKCDPITAADAAQLSKLTQLQELHMHDIDLGCEGVRFLSSLTALTLLELNECKPGAAGKAAIQAVY
jgi:Leucine-rich repeat (LRR) protein